jgi:phenylacetate-CoA ligase
MYRQLKALRQVMRDAELAVPELNNLIHRRLKAVLSAAYLNVSYYRDAMKAAGYNPLKDYTGPQDLVRLPVTTKQALKQRNVSNFIRSGADLSACFKDSTSGSTGIPLVIYRNSSERAVQIAKWLRVLFSNGYSVTDKVLSITGPTRLAEGRSFFQHFGILRRLPIDYRLLPEQMADALLDYKPDVIYGGRSFLELICMDLDRRGVRPKPARLIVATNEIIREGSRALIRRHFDVDLTESYGSVEMGVMAHETPARDGLRLCEDLTYFEFLDDQDRPVPPGSVGRVIVTDLTGETMPFIRYEQGDRAVFHEIADADGHKRRLLTRIVGRDDDYVLLPDGRRCTFDPLYEAIDEYHGITQFRVIQRSRTMYRILVVADSSYLAGIREDLARRLESAFVPGARYEIVPVNRIDPDPNGKTRIFISEAD